MKKNKGFTLVEVIVAVALLGVITVPIMSTLVRTAQINAKARNVQSDGRNPGVYHGRSY